MSAEEKPKPGRFGDLPAGKPGAAARNSPVPMVTQAFGQAAHPDEIALATRVHAAPTTPPLASVSGQLSAQALQKAAPAQFSRAMGEPSQSAKTTLAMSLDDIQRKTPVPSSSSSASNLVAAMGPNSAPPEIGLTQHHLPEERADDRMVLVNDPDGDRAAAFRVLRHHLMDAGRPQVIVVSSASRYEGKTTVALNLAMALAECGRAKVLLIEAHLRHPALATILRFVPPWCFAEQLAAHRHQPLLPWGLIEIPQLFLHVAAINPRAEQRQLLDAPAFAIAIERLRLGGYDHIVIDAPPVLGSADVNLIQDAADGVVMAVRAKKSNARKLRQAIDQLTPARVLGTVLLDE